MHILFTLKITVARHSPYSKMSELKYNDNLWLILCLWFLRSFRNWFIKLSELAMIDQYTDCILLFLMWNVANYFHFAPSDVIGNSWSASGSSSDICPMEPLPVLGIWNSLCLDLMHLQPQTCLNKQADWIIVLIFRNYRTLAGILLHNVPQVHMEKIVSSISDYSIFVEIKKSFCDNIPIAEWGQHKGRYMYHSYFS